MTDKPDSNLIPCWVCKKNMVVQGMCQDCIDKEPWTQEDGDRFEPPELEQID